MNPYDYKKDKRKGREALRHRNFISSISRFYDVLCNGLDDEIQNKIMRTVEETLRTK